jgi:alkanesulfonate monooxygenase SsuD/methylene tetrahydromethanopterin reductase-like flavin-dependent oxidoreductase (luciferase family)
MHIGYFTERPYAEYDENAVKQGGRTLLFSNKNFDPVVGSQLYNRYLDEKMYAEEVGFDGLMLNEHHQTPSCMGSVCDVEAAILARITKKPKIVLIGNILPAMDNPLRMAEELAIIDLISKGRLVSGWVRGIGTEMLSQNFNPTENRERFEEAHDFIVKAWSSPGPFRYEGKYFQYRAVNPWPVPLQKPHPPMMVPGGTSPETVIWAAKHRYPYVALSTVIETTKELWKVYEQTAQEEGNHFGPQNVGYLFRVMCGDTDQQAYDIGRGFLYAGAVGGFGAPPNLAWANPPGYYSKEAKALRAKTVTRGTQFGGLNYEKAVENFQLVVGTPKTVIPKLRHILEELRIGHLIIWGNDGTIGHEDTIRNMRMLGQEVIPALRQIAKEEGLVSSFESNDGTGWSKEAIAMAKAGGLMK